MKKIVLLVFVSVLLSLAVVATFIRLVAPALSGDERVDVYFADKSGTDENLTLTVIGAYDEDTFFSTNGDTFISSGLGSEYETQRALSVGAGKFDDSNFMYVGQKNVPEYCIWRAFVYFDTSPIPDDATIISAELSLYGSGYYTSIDYNVTVQNGQPAYPHEPAELGDYDLTHYSGNGGMLDTSGFVFGYNNITLNANGRSWINKVGTTKLCLRSDRDINVNPPMPGLENVEFWASEKGVGYKPKLHVIWTIPAALPSEEEVPFWTQWWFWTIVIAGIAVLAVAVYFLKKRKPPTPAAPALLTEGTLQKATQNTIPLKQRKSSLFPLFLQTSRFHLVAIFQFLEDPSEFKAFLSEKH